MKVFKKETFLIVVALMTSLGVTGCGGNSNGGESSMDKVAKSYMNSYADTDVELFLSLMPEEVMDYLEEEYYVAENQIVDIAEEHLEKWANRLTNSDIKEIKKNIKKAEIRDKNELETKHIQNLNEELGSIRAEEAYWVDYDNDFEFTIFRYDDKWYVYDVIEDIKEKLD